jgi:predicted Fe-Mo cluster-binding NifX family protein
VNIDSYEHLIKDIEVKENPAKDLDRKKGIKIAEFLMENNIGTVIVKEIGTGTYNALGNNYINVIKTDKNTVNEVVNEFIEILKTD